MRFHRIKVWLAGSIFFSFCLLVYKMTSDLPDSPNVAFQKGHLGHNGSFRHPHIIMRTSKGHGMTSQGDVLEEIDGHVPRKVNSKVKSLPHYLELQNDTSEIIPSNSTKITVRMIPLRVFRNLPPTLPSCPPKFTPNPQYPELDTLRNCATSALPYDPDLQVWLYKDDTMCEGRVHIYDAQAVLLRDVIIDKAVWDCQGSDRDTSDISGKRCVPQRGGFKIFCDFNDQPVKFFKGSVHNYLQHWLEVTVADRGKSTEVNEVEPRLTVAVQRHDHKNLYNTVAELYNAFISMKFYDESPENIKVLLIDTHSKGLSDGIWPKVFPNIDRIQDLDDLTLYQRMFWSPYGKQSLFVMHNEGRLAYVEQFRDFILNRFGVSLTSRLNCHRLRVTLLLYRDYSSGGSRDSHLRKQNEYEILKVIKQMHSSFIVEKVLMERYDIKDQLELAVNSDILIGIHGASLTHALFLPGHGGLIEFVPAYGQRHNSHYEALAKWRHLPYVRWENRDVIREGPDQVTVVPPFIVRDRMRKMYAKLCPSTQLEF